MNKLVITVNDIKSLPDFLKLKNVQRVLIGNEKFSNRVPKNCSIEDIKNVCEIANEYEKKVFVTVTKIFHENELDDLKEYLLEISNLGIDGIVFSDFAVYEFVQELDYKLELSYSTDTTITNSSFSDLAYDFNIQDVFLAKEITLNEIIEINELKKSKIGMFLHGHIYMYNGFRKLVKSYFEEVGYQEDYLDKKLYLYDEERVAYYPIVENEHGTNILSSDDQASYKFMKEILDSEIDYLLIDGFLYEPEQYYLVVKEYDKLINKYYELNVKNGENIEEFKKICNESNSLIKEKLPRKKFTNGFLKKASTY